MNAQSKRKKNPKGRVTGMNDSGERGLEREGELEEAKIQSKGLLPLAKLSAKIFIS